MLGGLFGSVRSHLHYLFQQLICTFPKSSDKMAYRKVQTAKKLQFLVRAFRDGFMRFHWRKDRSDWYRLWWYLKRSLGRVNGSNVLLDSSFNELKMERHGALPRTKNEKNAERFGMKSRRPYRYAGAALEMVFAEVSQTVVSRVGNLGGEKKYFFCQGSIILNWSIYLRKYYLLIFQLYQLNFNMQNDYFITLTYYYYFKKHFI